MPVIRFKGNKLDPASLKALVAETLIEGNATSKWWTRQSSEFLNTFMDTIRTSMNNGESLTQAIARVVGGTVDGVLVPGILKTTKRKAGALASTAINAVGNEAALRTFQANQDVIKWVSQVSTLDNKTSDICIAYSGQTWDVETLEPVNGSELPFNGGPPRHFNCRSRLRPVTKSFRELGIDLDEIPAGMRASMDGLVPADITFGQWLNGKPISFQNKLLGPKRAGLWRDGKITLTQLVDMRGNPMTLAQLEQKIGIAPLKAAPAPVVPKKKRPPPAPEVPEFKTVKEANMWMADNAVNPDSPFGRAVSQTLRGDKGAIRTFINVTMSMTSRFGLRLPNYFGMRSQHPTFRFKRKGANAAVEMPTDSLLLLDKGMRAKERFEQIVSQHLHYFGGEFKGFKTTRRGTREKVREFLINARKHTSDPALIRAIDDALEKDDLSYNVGGLIDDPEWQIWRTAVHEQGHRIHGQHFDEVELIIDEIRKSGDFTSWTGVTSGYSSYNHREFVAEQFMRYMKGDHVRVHPKLLDFFEKLDKGGKFGDDLFNIQNGYKP